MKIQDLFPGRIAATPVEVGFALGLSRQTTHNKLLQNRFPIPVILIDGRRMILIDDLQKFIDNARPAQPVRRGRPTKAEQFARAQSAEVSHE